MRLMHQILEPHIGKFTVVYFDNNLIYSKTEKDHQDHLTWIMMVLEQENLFFGLHHDYEWYRGERE